MDTRRAVLEVLFRIRVGLCKLREKQEVDDRSFTAVMKLLDSIEREILVSRVASRAVTA